MIVKRSLSLEHLDESSELSQVLPFLFLGSSVASLDLLSLKERGITHVINATRSHPNFHGTQIKYLRVAIRDTEGEDLKPALPKVCAFIEEARRGGGSALVHCSAGVSRSATLVLAYLLIVRRIPLLRALEICRNARPQVSPNAGFMSQLSSLEKDYCVRATLNLEKYTEDRFSSTEDLRAFCC